MILVQMARIFAFWHKNEDETMRIFLQIISPVVFLATIIVFVRKMIDYNKHYKAIVDFLRLENDRETLKSIGYVEFYGEEYGLRRSFSVLSATLRLYERFNETQKREYFDYAQYLEKLRAWLIPTIICLILSMMLLAFSFGSL